MIVNANIYAKVVLGIPFSIVTTDKLGNQFFKSQSKDMR
jgi:hypothetical protein